MPGPAGAMAYAATQLETHHSVIEWAFTNAVDLAKFQRWIV